MSHDPHNFVPVTPLAARKPWPQSGPRGHERFDQLSGTLHCVLATDSLLTIKANFEELYRQVRSPYLPGSSLKGMARNVLEMLGVGCAGFFHHNQEDRRTNPAGLIPCTEKAACVVCRLFGYSVEGKEFGWAGKLRFHDSDPAANWPPDRWKVYRHISPSPGAGRDFQARACVGAGEFFPFHLDYENLDPEEFTLLHFALTLRHQCERHSPEIRLLHKLGYGKGLGLGSCHIKIDRVEPENVKRYFPDQSGPAIPQPDSSIEQHLAAPPYAFMEKLLAPGPSRELGDPGEWGHTDTKSKPHSIGDHEAEANRRKPVLPPPPSPKLKPQPHADLPKKVKVRITGLDPGSIRGETLGEFNGHKYTCKARQRPYGRGKGDECMVEVDQRSVDHSKHFFEGKALA